MPKTKNSRKKSKGDRRKRHLERHPNDRRAQDFADARRAKGATGQVPDNYGVRPDAFQKAIGEPEGVERALQWPERWAAPVKRAMDREYAARHG